MKKFCFLIVFLLLFPSSVSYTSASGGYDSYRDIPGVTSEMISAVEAIKQTRESFTYGGMHSTESFPGEDGLVHGFDAVFCEYLSDLFGIPFKPAIYDWDDLISGMESFDVDFTGVLTPTDERRKTYYMTDGIAMHTINYFYVNENESPADILKERPLRLVFLEGENSINMLQEGYPYEYDYVTVGSFKEAHAVLSSGEADAYVADNTAEAAFSSYGFIISEEIYPLMYTPVSMSTRDASLEPIIAVVQAFLNAADSSILTDMSNAGLAEYKKHKFNNLLTPEEKSYLTEHGRELTVAGLADSYPVSFFNKSDGEWQGIAFDALKEVTALSGLTFNIAESTGKSEADLTDMLAAWEIEMIAGVSEDTDDGRVSFSDIPLFEDHYILASREELPEIELNEVYNKTVGFLGDEKYEEIFRLWFPGHRKTVTSGDANEAFEALATGEIDLAMTSRSGLLRVTHYLEQTGYKTNFAFKYPFDVSFGFNPEDEVLIGIVNKAMLLSDIPSITSRWADKNFDYQSLLLRSRLPLVVMGIVTAMVFAMAMLAFLYKSREGRRLRKLVAHQTTHLSAVINGIPDLIFCKDTNLKYTLVNTGFMSFFDLKEEDLLGNDIRATRRIDDKTFEELTERENAIIENRKPMREEQKAPDGKGGFEMFETVKVPIVQDGEVIGLLGVSRNITKRMETEQGVRAASESKTMFLANMSHEIRTPMNSIVGFSELALSDDIAPRTRDYLTKIIDNAEWLLHIIDDILDISKIESGKLSIKNVPFDLRDVFTRCQTTIAPAVAEKGLKLYCYAEPSIGRRLLGDPVRLRQVINNILSNAVKFTNVGTIKVSSAVRDIDETHTAVVFEVKDSGIGIAPELLPSIFDPFMQADSSITRKQGGTGLGLTIANNIINLMGGKLRVESAVGVGSRFFFELIFDTVEVTGNDKRRFDADMDIPKPEFDAHILLCEDNAMNQLVITEHLKKVGIKSTIAENGRIGVEKVTERVNKGEKPFDLIFMDIHMPEMDGLEAANRIMKLETGTPIIALTANIMSNDMEMYKENGMPDTVGKPFTSQELWKCLLKYLEPVQK